MAIPYGDPREYMEQMNYQMKKELHREKERMYREMQEAMGYGMTAPPVQKVEAPSKPSHLNPKLLLTKGA